MSGVVTGVVEIGKQATPIATMHAGGMLVQNTGDAPVTIGTADVKWEQGIMLPPRMDRPLLLPGGAPYDQGSGAIVIGVPGDVNASDPVVYGVSLSGDGRIAFLAPG